LTPFTNFSDPAMVVQIQSSPPRKRWWSLVVASLATLIVTADSGQLSIALPLIIKDLHADLALASWIALVYALITASLYLPCGRMADLLGVGKLFLAGFVLYAISSVAAGAAQGAGQLIFFRTSGGQRAHHGQ
jgi:MFS family permease